MAKLEEDWPYHAAGDFFRSLADDSFDFSRYYPVNHHVDFEAWLPTAGALALLRDLYGEISVYPPDEHGDGYGYAQFQVFANVSYEGVTAVRRQASAAMKLFSGIRES